VWLITCRDQQHAASGAARVILDSFVRSGERQFALALSGGRIAPVLFRELVYQSERRGTRFAEADFFWTDERCVRPDHEESNFYLAKTGLLDPLGVPAEHIHRLRGEWPPEQAAESANEDWTGWVHRRPDPSRAMDCIILGVGEDGHVASLFPSNMGQDLADHSPFRAVVGPKPPPQRLTMGYPLLWTARQVVVLAAGKGKAEIVTLSLSGKRDTPLSRVVHGREGRETVILTHATPGNGV
jgi:6-phosphogluconolactonase